MNSYISDHLSLVPYLGDCDNATINTRDGNADLSEIVISVILEIYLEVGLLDHMVFLVLIL